MGLWLLYTHNYGLWYSSICGVYKPPKIAREPQIVGWFPGLSCHPFCGISLRELLLLPALFWRVHLTPGAVCASAFGFFFFLTMAPPVKKTQTLGMLWGCGSRFLRFPGSKPLLVKLTYTSKTTILSMYINHKMAIFNSKLFLYERVMPELKRSSETPWPSEPVQFVVKRSPRTPGSGWVESTGTTYIRSYPLVN